MRRPKKWVKGGTIIIVFGGITLSPSKKGVFGPIEGPQNVTYDFRAIFVPGRGVKLP